MQIVTAITAERAEIGVPYSWGGGGWPGPSLGTFDGSLPSGAVTVGFDCSGLQQYGVYKGTGQKIPRSTAGIVTAGDNVAQSDLLAGDLVMPTNHHVQMYTGNGNIIEAPETGQSVHEIPMWGFWRARRVMGGGADVTPGVLAKGTGSSSSSSTSSSSSSSSTSADDSGDVPTTSSFLGSLQAHLQPTVGILDVSGDLSMVITRGALVTVGTVVALAGGVIMFAPEIGDAAKVAVKALPLLLLA